MRKLIFTLLAAYAWKWMTGPSTASASAERRRHDQTPRGGRVHR